MVAVPPARLVRGPLVGLVLDRPGFMAAPTSCAPSAITAAVSTPGGPATLLSQRFAMTGCSKLKFSPKMSIKAIKSTKKAGAGLHVKLTQTAGQANLKSVSVRLPKQIAIKLKALGKLCTQAQLAADACPAATKVGGASATTPPVAVAPRRTMAAAGRASRCTPSPRTAMPNTTATTGLVTVMDATTTSAGPVA